jgi:hypothetical protein
MAAYCKRASVSRFCPLRDPIRARISRSVITLLANADAVGIGGAAVKYRTVCRLLYIRDAVAIGVGRCLCRCWQHTASVFGLNMFEILNVAMQLC